MSLLFHSLLFDPISILIQSVPSLRLKVVLRMASLRHRYTNSASKTTAPKINQMEDPSSSAEQPLLESSQIRLSVFERFADWIAIFINTYAPFISSILGHGIRCPRVGPGLRADLDRIAKFSREGFEPASRPDHAASLQLLWNVSFPGARYPEIGHKSEQWKEMGWQGSDPATDTRGAGAFSIKQLLYMAREHADLYDTLLNKRLGTRVEWEYPFAASGVNLTFMLLELIGISGPGVRPSDRWSPPKSVSGAGFVHLLKQEMITSGADPREAEDRAAEGAAGEMSVLTFKNRSVGMDLLGELYCIAYRRLDQVWLARKASYMQFPKILGEVKEEMRSALAACPKSVQSIRDRVLEGPEE